MAMEQEEYEAEASEYERAPDDFEADFTLKDTQVPDHPVIVDVEGMGEASARLASWGLVEDLQDGDGEAIEFDASTVAQIIRDHYKSPSFEQLHADGVRKMHLVHPDNLLEAIMPGMSARVNPDGSAQVDTKN